MKSILERNSKYMKIIFTIVISYIFIKLIDNISIVIDIADKWYTILTPFLLAFVIAYILNPIVKLFNKKAKIPRPISIAITYVLFLGIIAIALVFIGPKLYTSIIELINNLPEITTDIQNFVNNLSTDLFSQLNLTENPFTGNDATTIISTVSALILELSNWLLSSAFSITSSIINVVLGFLISVYVLVDKDDIIKFCKRITLTICGNVNGNRMFRFVNILNYKIGSYVGIKAIDSSIIALLAFIGLSLIGSKYVLLLTVIVGLTNMIPYFGPFIGMTVGAFINLFFNPFTALIVFLFLFGLQQFDGWYLDPKLIGNRVGLSPFLVILGVTIGGAIYGPVGMILGSPVMAVIKIYTFKILDRFKHRTELPLEIEE